MNKLQIGLIVSCLLLVGLVFGCTSNPTYSTPANATSGSSSQQTAAPAATTVQTLELYYAHAAKWTASADVSGIEVTLEPKDVNDKIVETDGTATIQLWNSTYKSISSMERVKSNSIQNWTVTVSKDNYDYMGTKLRLNYKPGFIPQDGYGWLEVMLTTPDGKNFTATDKQVTLYLIG